MAYLVPNGDTVAFNFITSGYAPPNGGTVPFIFIDVLLSEETFLDAAWAANAIDSAEVDLLTAAWSVEVFVTLDLSVAYAVGGVQQEDGSLDAIYAVIAPVSLGELPLDVAWVVDPIPLAELDLGMSYGVVAVNLFNHPLTQRYEVIGGGAGTPFFMDVLWFLSPGVAQETIVLYNEQIANQTIISYPIGTTTVAQETIVNYDVREQVAVEDVIDSNLAIVQDDTIIKYNITDDAKQETIVRYDMLTQVAAEHVIRYDIKTTDTAQQSDVLLYPILSDTIISVNVVPTVTVNGVTIPVEDAEVSYDEGQFAWTCHIVLRDPAHYALFDPDIAFSVDMLGEVYSFILDSKEFVRANQTSISAVISGISPSALFATPRAAKITKTWDVPTFVTDVVAELFGAAAVWEIINWPLPAFRLAASDQTPIDILQTLAEAAGGIVTSDPDGTIRARYLHPVSVVDYGKVTPDQEYSDIDHNFSVREQFTHFDLVNKLRILDIARDAFSDSVDFEVDPNDPTRGKLKVFPSPWRETITMTHTSTTPVSVSLVGVETEQIVETVEVLRGEGNTSKPIYQVQSLEWLYEDLAGIAFDSDSTQFKSTHATKMESLLKITYLTRYVRFDAVGYPEREVQFLVKDTENG